MNWHIQHFADYHDIRGDDVIDSEGEFTAIELGCFPVPEFNCHRYFGLFFRGRRPSVEKIVKAMQLKVLLGQDVEDADDGWTLANLKEEIRHVLGLACGTCGEHGHRPSQCPERHQVRWKQSH